MDSRGARARTLHSSGAAAGLKRPTSVPLPAVTDSLISLDALYMSRLRRGDLDFDGDVDQVCVTDGSDDDGLLEGSHGVFAFAEVRVGQELGLIEDRCQNRAGANQVDLGLHELALSHARSGRVVRNTAGGYSGRK